MKRGGTWHWHKPMNDGNCSAWARWLVAVQLPPWSFGLIRESWGLRICLSRWQLVYHEPTEGPRLMKFIWKCECNAGSCEFDTQQEAYDGSNSKFCGRSPVIKKVREESTKDVSK